MKLINIEAVSTSSSMAFVDWSDASKPEGLSGELRSVSSDVYPAESAMFGRFVRTIRVASGRSIREVAAALDLSPSRYCDIERGAARPETEDDLKELASAVLGQELQQPDIFNAVKYVTRHLCARCGFPPALHPGLDGSHEACDAYLAP